MIFQCVCIVISVPSDTHIATHKVYIGLFSVFEEIKFYTTEYNETLVHLQGTSISCLFLLEELSISSYKLVMLISREKLNTFLIYVFINISSLVNLSSF